MSLNNAISKMELQEFYENGYSDAYIGFLYGMTGEGIAYRRKKYGISLSDKKTLIKEKIRHFKSQSYDTLNSDYKNLAIEDFSKKYGLSKTVWKRLLKERGFLLRTPHRVVKYPGLTQEQRRVVIGGLLGDGSVSQGDFYYESHSKKQELYLRKKHNILKPYSGKIYPVDNDTGFRFKTVRHPEFREFFKQFYVAGDTAKQIPLDFLKNNWHESLLVYWYLDDGHFDDAAYELSIANKAPTKQLLEFSKFLEDFYRWSYHVSIGNSLNKLTFSKKFYDVFFRNVIEIATPDLYYKIPERMLTEDMIDLIPYYSEIKPKFYRKASGIKKTELLNRFVETLIVNGFPEPALTDKRKGYLKNQVGRIATFRLCEHAHPEIYEEAKIIWKSKTFLHGVAEEVLLNYPTATGSFIRKAVRKLLNIEVIEAGLN